MEQYAGLDVSLKAVSICVSDGAGTVLWRGEVLNDGAAVVAALGLPLGALALLMRHAMALAKTPKKIKRGVLGLRAFEPNIHCTFPADLLMLPPQTTGCAQRIRRQGGRIAGPSCLNSPPI